MAFEKFDYNAILADMKVKRSALDTSIAGLEAALASGALGQAAEGEGSTSGSSTVTGIPLGQPMDLPSGAFLGKSMPDAIKLYLSAVRQRKTARDIATALKAGGMVSTSDDFESVVQASVQRLKSMGHLLKFADGWGLTEWSPPGFRPSADRIPKTKKKAKKKKAKTKATAPTEQPKPTAARQAGDQAATEMAAKIQEMPKAV